MLSAPVNRCERLSIITNFFFPLKMRPARYIHQLLFFPKGLDTHFWYEEDRRRFGEDPKGSKRVLEEHTLGIVCRRTFWFVDEH